MNELASDLQLAISLNLIAFHTIIYNDKEVTLCNEQPLSNDSSVIDEQSTVLPNNISAKDRPPDMD